MIARRTAFPFRFMAFLAVITACSGEAVTEGMEEPIRVRNAQFFEGTLPGSPPLTREQMDNGETPRNPTVTSVDGASGVLRRGDPERSIRGRVTGDAYAVAVRFPDLGSGYWVLPASTPDAAFEGEFTFSLSAELGRTLPPGEHQLLFAAIDAEGRAGTQRNVGLCVVPPYPDNLNACDPKREPPNLVVSLAWDVNADMDLQVLTPSGVLVDAKHPNTELSEGMRPSADAGVLEQDASAGCIPDGLRRENLVFNRPAPSGEYFIYANLFDPCGERAVHFTASIYSAVPAEEPGTFAQVESYRRSGTLLAVQANGGAKAGLLVTKFIVP